MIDLNADLGEGMGTDEALLRVVTSANIACGGHTGTPDTMRTAVELATENGVVIGAHPSYPDRQGFGRRPMNLGEDDLVDTLGEQVQTLIDQAAAAGRRVRYIKPHGALYHEVLRVPEHGRALIETAAHWGLPVLLAPQARTGDLARSAGEHGVQILGEGFVDRAYGDDGGLRSRTEEGAVLTDAKLALDQALSLARGQVRTVSGRLLNLRVNSLCVHGDTPGAVTLAESIRAGLEQARVTVGAWSEQ